MNVMSLTSRKSHDVVPNASFTRHDVSHCSVDVTIITELCISATYQISSSGSSLTENSHPNDFMKKIKTHWNKDTKLKQFCDFYF
jgi:hypothetical protein